MSRFIPCFLLLAFTRTLFSQEPFDLIKTKHVEIHIDSIAYSQQKIWGYTNLIFEPKDSVITKLYLYLAVDTLDSVYVNLKKCNATLLNGNLYEIATDSLFKGIDYHLRIWYHGKSAKDPQNFGGVLYLSNYVFNLGVSLNLVPHSFGRAWFPTTDHFQDKATYSFFVRADSSQVVVCNGTLQDVVSIPGTSQRLWHWQIHDSIPAYLASFAIGNYEVYDTIYQSLSGTSIPVSIYVPPSVLPNVQGTFQHLFDALEIFENLFGYYRWERIGYVAVPFNGGAMEHATNIAIPILVVNGNTTYETLLFHELSHHWFGNLVTCKTPEEMWLNEGWARYAEYLFLEHKYDKATAQNLYRNTLASTLENAHIDDGDFYPVGNVPPAVTYGTTVYDKGLLVAHTLRNYMGDSLFFSALKHYLQQFAYKNAGNEDFKNALQASSGLNLDDFFEGWVYSKGFPQVDVKYFTSSPMGNNHHHVKVVLQQKLYGASDYWKEIKIDLVFYDSLFHHEKVTANIFGKFDTLEIDLPFKPYFVWLDPEDKVADACVGDTFFISNPGYYTVNKAYVWYKVSHVPTPFKIRIEHHVAPPDTGTFADTIFRISPNHYWKISGFIPQGTVDTLQFQYIRTKIFNDKLLLISSASIDSIVLLYRRDANDAWKIIPFSRVGNTNIGKLITPYVANGEYAFGIGKPINSVLPEINQEQVLRIYPNPGNQFLIECQSTDIEKIVIINNFGKTADVIEKPSFPYLYKPMLKSGVYYLQLIKKGKAIYTKPLVIIKD